MRAADEKHVFNKSVVALALPIVVGAFTSTINDEKSVVILEIELANKFIGRFAKLKSCQFFVMVVHYTKL